MVYRLNFDLERSRLAPLLAGIMNLNFTFVPTQGHDYVEWNFDI